MSFPETAVQWWQSLEHSPGDRAALRRADDLVAAVPIRACRDFLVRTGGIAADDRSIEARVAVTLVLAHVRRDEGSGSFARRLGLPPNAETPVLTETRFRRLLKIESPLELVLPLRRALRFTDHAAPVADLSLSILSWGERTRRRWLFEYFNESAAAPASNPAA
ncbi:type I-E CRISPR-associated protein Cse2/CasB [Magnetospirillum molischianum]|uniref:Putative Cse2 family CRISPR-associated protein n=1 Tax=Magnetospirillum molischianum DSM 120 TaxID=1150626 RepID=H8FVT4_MAGML|nr:type I-E CRISPR-associated protein Cse2/CasB [Magnetospirillum molischianum]CCG42472.1 putative Cse2 family CRISPR-associated protein [Magnetospirillum molischianum DSM 120]